jgi:hypothetical protein
MEFLMGFDDQEIQVLPPVVEDDIISTKEADIHVAPVVEKILSPLDIEIMDLLLESSPDVIEQYKMNEVAIRNSYQEFSALELPKLDPSHLAHRDNLLDAPIPAEPVKIRPKTADYLYHQKNISYLKKNGILLPSEKLHKQCLLPKKPILNSFVETIYKRPETKIEKVVEPEFFSPGAVAVPNLPEPNISEKRGWRPKSAFPKISIGASSALSKNISLVKPVKPEHAPGKKMKKKGRKKTVKKIPKKYFLINLQKINQYRRRGCVI